VCQTN